MSWLSDVGRAIAGAVPGGADVFDSLSTSAGRDAAAQGALERIRDQVGGAVTGATAGAGAVIGAQNTSGTYNSAGGQQAVIWLAVSAGLAAFLIFGRR